MADKKYFFYETSGNRVEKYNSDCIIISEVRLPRKLKGPCVSTSLKNAGNIPVYKKVNLAFGDPRKIMYCKCLSKNSDDVPEIMRSTEAKYGNHSIWKFKYKGKFFWACEFTRMCLLKDWNK